MVVAESYITHIRILEDGEYPSTPPPPQSPPQNKKPRVIVIAVRKSGRVRMHKCRENNNGSFSIGKTWVLDDLCAILSYSNLVPSNPEEQQAKERAGTVGFVVTIQKPYYWQASTPKEKDFFIFSLIKIYKKYTAGKLPQLHGFEKADLEQLGGSPMPTPRFPSSRTAANTPRTPGTGMTNGSPSPDPVALGGERVLLTPQLDQEHESNRGPRERPSQDRPMIPNGDPRMRQQEPYNRAGSEARSRPSQESPLRNESETRSRPSQESSLRNESDSRPRQSQERALKPSDSDDRVPYMPGQFPTSDFVRNLQPQGSQTQMNGRRSDSPSGSSAYSGGLVQPQQNLRKLASAQSNESFRNASDGQSSRYQPSQRPSEERMPPAALVPGYKRSDSSDSQRPSTSGHPRIPSNLSIGTTQEGIAHDQAFQDPKLPTSAPAFNQNKKGFGSEVSTPNLPAALSAGLRSDGLQESQRSEIKTQYDATEPKLEMQPLATSMNGDPGQHLEQPRESQNRSSLSNNTASQTLSTETPPASNPPTPAAETPTTETETHRPGLGPMIKTKKSNNEIAAKFRNAANSYNSFKPRPGGAAERLQNAKGNLSNEPDGITGVVPAPSLLRGASEDQVKSPNAGQAQVETTLTPITTDRVSLPPYAEPPKPVSRPVSPEKSRETPAVRISTPPSKRPSSISIPQDNVQEIPPPTPEKDARRSKRKSDHSAKYAKALKFNPSVLEGRTHHIESVLNDFGWVEESSERNTFDELQSGISKELARIEAGSWLETIENNDERITAVGDLMDRVIKECEEFDCLLTLYNVELGVGVLPTLEITNKLTIARLLTKMSLTLKHSLKACRFKQLIRRCSRLN